jgi:hypothetical protein
MPDDRSTLTEAEDPGGDEMNNTIQKALFTSAERIDAICRECKSHVPNDGKITPLSQSTGTCCSTVYPQYCTEGGCITRCPEGKW